MAERSSGKDGISDRRTVERRELGGVGRRGVGAEEVQMGRYRGRWSGEEEEVGVGG